MNEEKYNGSKISESNFSEKQDFGPVVESINKIYELLRSVLPGFILSDIKPVGINTKRESILDTHPYSANPNIKTCNGGCIKPDDMASKISNIFEKLGKIEINMRELASLPQSTFDQEEVMLGLVQEMNDKLARLEENLFASEDGGCQGPGREEQSSLRPVLEDITGDLAAIKVGLAALGEKLAETDDGRQWEDLRLALATIQEQVARLPRSFPEPPDISGELDKFQDKLDDIERLVLDTPNYMESLENLSRTVGAKAKGLGDAVDNLTRSLDTKLDDHFKTLGVNYDKIDRRINTSIALEEEIKKAQERFEKGVAEGLAKLMNVLSSLERIWKNELGPALGAEGEKSILSSLKTIFLPRYDKLYEDLHSDWLKSTDSLNILQTNLNELKNDIIETNKSLEQENRTLEQENSDAQRGLGLANERLRQAESEGRKNQEALDALGAARDSLREKVQALEKQLMESKRHNEELGQKISAKDKVLAEESSRSSRLEEKWKPWQDRLNFYVPVQTALRSSPFFASFADSEQICDGEEGLFNCMKSLGKSSDFLRSVHEYASREKARAIKENRAEPMQDDEIRVYDALNKCYRVLLGKDFDYFVQSGDRPVTMPFEKVKFNKTNDRHMREPNDRSRVWVQRIYVPMLKNDAGDMIKPAEVEAGND